MDKYTANNSRPKVLYLVSAGCKRFEKTRLASLHYLRIAEVHHQLRYLTRLPSAGCTSKVASARVDYTF